MTILIRDFEEYKLVRDQRNKLRDRWESLGSSISARGYLGQIKLIDKVLSEVEKNNPNFINQYEGVRS